MIGPFTRYEENPIMGPNFDSPFNCPLSKKLVRWEGRAILGAASIVINDTMFLIYHGEDFRAGLERYLRYKSPGTMRLGLAHSTDGFNIKRNPTPVVYPDNDFLKDQEWPGGSEIPRIVEGPDNTYYLYYSGWNHKVTRLLVATSNDLIRWKKHGLAFGKADGGKYAKMWCKSAAVVQKIERGKLVATKINGKYWMYFGDSDIYAATSDDLINWKPVLMPDSLKNKKLHDYTYGDRQSNKQKLGMLSVMSPRGDKFDNGLVEGGMAVLTKDCIVHIYNSMNRNPELYANGFKFEYSLGQALYDKNDPTKLIDRSDETFYKPEMSFEKEDGIVPYVIFATGLSYYKGKWFLYYNGADTYIGLATASNLIIE